LFGLPATAAWAQTVVSIEFDDGIADQYQVRSALSSHGMHGTFFVNTGVIDTSTNWLTWSQVGDLASDGNEIADHGVQHLALATDSSTEQAREICGDRANLFAHGFQPTDYAYPYGSYSSTTESTAKSCGFNSARAVGGLDNPYCCVESETIPPADVYATRSIVLTSSDTLSSMESYVTHAESSGGGWVQLVFHFICSGCDSYAVSLSNFSSFLDWLAPRAAQGTVVKTVQQVIGGAVQPLVQPPPPPPVGTGPNLLQNPSLESNAGGGSIPDCWQAKSFGSNSSSFIRTTNAHSGSYAEELDVSNYSDGAARLVILQDLGQCSPSVAPGHSYVLGAWYESNAPVYFVTYYRNATGTWTLWQSSPTFPASSGWSHASWTTPPIPSDAQGLSFGMTLSSNGSLTTDDYSLADAVQTVGVSISAPLNGAAVSGIVPLTAVAVSPYGIARVDFLVNGQVVGSDTTLPYVLNWDSTKVADGTVTVTSRAVDTLGNVVTSTGISLTVDNTPPTVAIACNLGPCSSSAYPSAPVSVTLSASDGGSGIGSIHYTTDGTTPTLLSPSYTGAIGLNSTATIRYRAWDQAGNASAIGQQAITINAPTVTLTAPPAGTTIEGPVTFTTSIGGMTPVKVRFYADGVWIGFTQSAPWSLQWDPFGPDGTSVGTHQFTAVAYDAAGNATTSPPVQLTIAADTVAPSSAASAPALSRLSSIALSYSASDNTYGSGLADVDLYAEGPGQSSYTKVASDASGSASGSFSYSASAGDGVYRFYTVATDKAGNVQQAPATPNATTLVDTTSPSSSASTSAATNSSSLTVLYSASDSPGGSGLAEVDLYARAPGQSAYSKVASDTSGNGLGSFSYRAAAGDGTYSFYTIATDRAGNVEAAPASADTSTLLDRVAPTSSATAPTLRNASAVTVSYTASDNQAGSGLFEVDLYAKGPGQSAYGKVASDMTGATSGSFNYVASSGDGSYSFYTVASDIAGNTQATPSAPQASTLLDTTAPTSAASAPGTSSLSAINVSYTAGDNQGGSGLAEVDLYAKPPGQPAYSEVASDKSGIGIGSFSYSASAGDGTYSFYTLATDRAGNVQPTPTAAQASTLLDTGIPSSTASSPATTNASPISVSYSASAGSSGLARVDLYAKAPGQLAYGKVASDTTGSTSGTFSYSASAGDGTYSFYTLATSKAGVTQLTPLSPQATTLLDTTPPSSTASAPGTSGTTAITVSYTASDNQRGSGLAEVDLYAEAPGQSSYSKIASDLSGSGSGSFSYTASAGDGTYTFYTIATDVAGNVQPKPTAAQASTVVSASAPTSSASTLSLSSSAALTISYTASAGAAGLAEVDLYAEGPGQSAFSKVASDTSGASSGTFSYNASSGDGTYGFYTVATDRAGHVQPTPAGAQATTLLDTKPPSSSAAATAVTNEKTIGVSYTAADTPGGSGVAGVDLYAEAPGQSSYTKVASDTSGGSSGTFSYSASSGDGTYSFYTVATDTAGNVQPAPSAAQAVSLLDTAPPGSAATAPALTNAKTISVSYTAADTQGGSGVARVDLYARAPGQSGYTKAASDTSGSTSGSLSYAASSGDGTYSFYTIATDEAGNSQIAPSAAQAITQLDSTPPSSSASTPSSVSFGSITVSYSASDGPDGSGLVEVDLYVQAPGQNGYSQVASDTSGGSSGSFSYAPSAGNGTYNFYTLATDKAGNVQATPTTPNASTNYQLDTTAPTSTASAPAYANGASWTVSYTASDNPGGSGVAAVELWAKPPGASGYSRVATSTSSAGSGSFTYTAPGAEGSYGFYTIAVDQAGNRQSPPTSAQATSMLDTTAPTAFQMNTPPQYLAGSVNLSLSSTPADSGSGLGSVSYQERPSGSTNWSTACTAKAPPWSCSWNTATTATPDGQYDVQAVAADAAGNTTTASNTPFAGLTIENTKPAAQSIATSNVSGGTRGKIDQGDTVTFTYTQAMDPGSIMAGWTGASTPVQIHVAYNKNRANQLTIWTAGGSAQLGLANPLGLGGNYVGSGGAILNGTITQNGASVTVTIGALLSGSLSANAVTKGTLTWIPSSSATNLAGVKCTTTGVSATGPAF
jgi:hypothetical protein